MVAIFGAHESFGRQLQDQAVVGAVPEGRLSLAWESVTGAFADGERFALRAPRYRIEAAGWRGDRHAIYVNGGESVVAARVRFADADEAREFDATHRAAVLADAEAVTEGALTLATRADGMTVALVEPPGRDALFTIGSNAAIARAALEALLGG